MRKKMAKVVRDLVAAVRDLEATMVCNCDLDNWEPEFLTGHVWVCRIHRAAIATYRDEEGG